MASNPPDGSNTSRSIGCLVIGVLTIMVLFLGLRSCTREDVLTLRSPDGKLEAVLTETNGGATTSFGYLVRIRSTSWLGWPGKQVANFYDTTRSDCAYGVDIDWLDTETLEIAYLETRSVEADTEIIVGGHPVSIVVRKGTANPKAPCGGMGYNLRGRTYG